MDRLKEIEEKEKESAEQQKRLSAGRDIFESDIQMKQVGGQLADLAHSHGVLSLFLVQKWSVLSVPLESVCRRDPDRLTFSLIDC